MAEQTSYVIIGNGIAGVTAAEILRTEDSAAAITVIADDPFPVFYRPALKDYLAGRVREDKLWARSASFYQDHNIRFLSERAVRIHAAGERAAERPVHAGDARRCAQIELRGLDAHAAHRLVVEQAREVYIRPALPQNN